VKGFSTIEIVVTSIILFLLIIIAARYYFINVEYAKLAVFTENLRFIKMASEKFYIDKSKFPDTILDLFTDPYKDYLPRQFASNFIYSPWNTEIYLKSFYLNNMSLLYLYLELRRKNNGIPKFIEKKMEENQYFRGYFKEYIVFLVSFVYR